MIAFVQGEFVTKTPSQVIVNVNGIGYELQISLNTYAEITDKGNGKLLTLIQIDKETKIEAVYTACVEFVKLGGIEFVKWYNENQ